MNTFSKIFGRLALSLLITLSLTHCAIPTSEPSTSFPSSQVTGATVVQSTTTPKQIALLLPLHGPMEAAGSAIKNGFLAAYYADAQNGTTVSHLKMYDTSTGDIVQLYQKAIQEGADFIVGPLTKNNVQLLAHSGAVSTTTLALNTLPGSIDNKYIIQFGLSPFDEAEQAARRAWANGNKTAVILVSNSGWGQHIANVFEQTFTQLGGQVLSQLTLSPNNASSQIKRFFDLNSSIDEKTPGFIPKKRQDVGMIYLIAELPAAEQIIPLLRYYYAGDIPLYALSQLYPAKGVDQSNADLNNVYFCDMPWVLDPSHEPTNLQQLRLQIETIWPDSYSNNKKLYALGIDAYTIATKKLPFTGATGNLSLDQHQHIYRQLLWAQFKNGLPVLVP